MRRTVLTLFFALIIASPGWAEWVGTTSQPKSARFQVISSHRDATLLQVDVPGFHKQVFEAQGRKMARILIPGAGVTDLKGYPALPKISKDLMVPASAESVEVRIVREQRQEFAVEAVEPSKGSLLRNVDPASVPYSFAEFYQKNLEYPTQSAVASAPFIMRDVHGVNLQIFPVQYNPAKGTVSLLVSAQIEIRHRNQKGFNLFTKGDGELDQSFASLYSDHFSNFDVFEQGLKIRSVQHWIPDNGRLLIVTHPNFAQAMEPFIAWKNERGLEVKMVTTNEVGGAGYRYIASYIKNEYATKRISHVILVGDSEFVPFHPGTAGNAKGNEADPMYGLVEGNDKYPDLFVARFSVKTVADVENHIARSIAYEKSPMDDVWYSKGVGIASAEGDPTDFWRAEQLRTMLMKWHYSTVDQFYDSNKGNASKTGLAQALNEGRGYINYIGHGSETAWVTTGFNTTDISRLQNAGKLPFIVSVACVNGNFAYSGGDSFAERWLKAGTAQNPIGAVAVFASSTNQSWVPPTVGQKAISELLVAEKLNTIGSLFFHGSVAVLEDNSSTADQTFQTWHIFGDPTLMVRTQKPSLIKVKQVGMESVEGMNLRGIPNQVVVDVGEKGISAGLVQGGKLIGKGVADQMGKINVKMIAAFDPNKPVAMTLTGFNKRPLNMDLSLTRSSLQVLRVASL